MLALFLLIIMLGVLIFVHEFGHFITAKKSGAYVYEFAIGMGPKIFSFKRKNKNDPTIYSLRLFPVGGFCAIAGEISEDADDSGSELKLDKSQYMCNLNYFSRCLIMIAGVTMNFITGILLLFISGLIWGSVDQECIIGDVPSTYEIDEKEYNYPAYEAGLEVGDKILEINGKKVNTWDRVTLILNLKYTGKSYNFTILKADGSTKKYEIEPNIIKNKDGSETKVFGIGQNPKRNYGVVASMKYAFLKTGTILRNMVSIIGNLFTGKLSISSLSGPIGVYSVTKEAAKTSPETVVYLMAYLSLNLGFINILPFPAFDGGRVLLLIIEAIRKKKMNSKIENLINTVGFVILMLMMIIISIKDIINLF